MGVGCVGRACEGSRSSSFVFVSNVRRLRRLRRLRLSCRASRREVTTGEEPGDFRRDKPAQEGPAGSRLARVRSEGSRGSSHPRLPGWLKMDPRWWRGARGPDPRRGSTASRGRSRICASRLPRTTIPRSRSRSRRIPRVSRREATAGFRRRASTRGARPSSSRASTGSGCWEPFPPPSSRLRCTTPRRTWSSEMTRATTSPTRPTTTRPSPRMSRRSS